MPGRFELYRDQADAFRVRLKAAIGEIVATGQPYPTRQGAAAGIDAVRRAAAEATVEDPSTPPVQVRVAAKAVVATAVVARAVAMVA